MKEENNRYALITGATSGIGFEIARLFANDNWNLIIVGRMEDSLNHTREKLANDNIDILTVQSDLFSPRGAYEVYDLVSRRGLQVEALVNDAGQGQYGEFVNTDLDRELDIIQLNVCSVVILTKLFLRPMLQRGGGMILNVASVAGKYPGPWQAVYHGTKAFIHSFTEAVRSEVRDTGVHITSLLPGETATEFFRKADMLHSKNVVENELADPDEVAKDGY